MQNQPILRAVIKCLLDKSNFRSVFSESMKNVEINESFLESFSNGLKLSLLEKIANSLALSDSENPNARLCGNFHFNYDSLERDSNSTHQRQTAAIVLLSSQRWIWKSPALYNPLKLLIAKAHP